MRVWVDATGQSSAEKFFSSVTSAALFSLISTSEVSWHWDILCTHIVRQRGISKNSYTQQFRLTFMPHSPHSQPPSYWAFFSQRIVRKNCLNMLHATRSRITIITNSWIAFMHEKLLLKCAHGSHNDYYSAREKEMIDVRIYAWRAATFPSTKFTHTVFWSIFELFSPPTRYNWLHFPPYMLSLNQTAESSNDEN